MTESKSKGLPDEPFGQHLADVSAALSSVYVEQLHSTDFALHKRQPNCCKNNPETSTRPSKWQPLG
ncbi:hypothetical protein ACE02Y_01105 [Shewanella xiamenensis]|uniref:Uncharacterized protein n=2 Tax=Shewanella xiamenensis TaxID=332186 RepID=A0AAE4Q025_9GAMM|nr:MULTISPECIES: hypothetical protein [Shewanella]MCT8859232.1 hypothetical protein [Shewanella xiamenensis]MDH1626130.1 hypothetical protein [Shewanella xiamenensis]MDV5390334.1 hypothetical protein [Shewanella xiamenensis]PWH02435.1 hypothetical protein DIY08_12400 [Shewanella xiamenensis]UWG62927.1 hypothetical protein K5M76_11670 [Shewanella xiamenensis]